MMSMGNEFVEGLQILREGLEDFVDGTALVFETLLARYPLPRLLDVDAG